MTALQSIDATVVQAGRIATTASGGEFIDGLVSASGDIEKQQQHTG